MINITHYMDDGANWQAQAVLAYLRWNSESVTYLKNEHDGKVYIKVGRFENCREQGYIFTLNYNFGVVMNYAVYEHRNSDSLCVLLFKTECNLNTPTLDEVWKDKKDKWDVDKTFSWGHITDCGEWIIDDMKNRIQEILNKKNYEQN